MIIIDQIKRLINGSPDAQAAMQHMITTLAAEAVKTGNPDALVAVAAQWEQLQETSSPMLAQTTATLASVPDFTTASQMSPIVIRIMQQAYMAGVTEITNGTIKKALDQYMQKNGGWRDADLRDNNPAPGIQPLWWSTLSRCLQELKAAGEVSSDPKAWRTYTLAPHNLPPAIAGATEAPSLNSWEAVA